MIKVIGSMELLSNVYPSSQKADQLTLGVLSFLDIFIRGIKVESPNPTNIQKIALATLPVIAISPKPLRVMANEALKSARQLPQQSRVRAKNLGFRDNINPKFVSKSIIKFETNAIQDTDCINAMIPKKKIILLEAYNLVVLNLMWHDNIIPGINNPKQIYKGILFQLKNVSQS